MTALPVLTLTALAAVMGRALLDAPDLHEERELLAGVYGKPLSVCIGYDPQRTDWKTLSPFAAFVPMQENESTGESGQSRQRGLSRVLTLGLVLGVVDDAECLLDDIPCLRGLTVLAGVAPAMLAALPDAVARVHPTLTITGSEIRYDFERHPLMTAEVTLTVTEAKPIGG